MPGEIMDGPLKSKQDISKIESLILYDGVCNFCNFWVQWIIKLDKKGQFYFISLQSVEAATLLGKRTAPPYPDSIVFSEQGNLSVKSRAVLQIGKKLNTPYRQLAKAFDALKLYRLYDFIYDLVAKNRYRLFGQKTVCKIPPVSVRKRFLG